eukprot:g5452.t1
MNEADGNGGRKWAAVLMDQFCVLHQQSLDAPVHEYLCNMLVEFTSDEVDFEESFKEMINSYFVCSVSTDDVKNLVKEFESVRKKSMEEPMIKAVSKETNTTTTTTRNSLDFGEKSFSSSRLNASAEEFFPVQKKTELKNSDFSSQEQDLADFIGSYLEDPNNDPTELLLQMFPYTSKEDLELLYNSNNQRFSLTLEALLQGKGSGSWIQDNSEDLHPTRLDLNSKDFPELQSCQRTSSTGSIWTESKESFLDVVKKKPISPPQTPSAASTINSLLPSGGGGGGGSYWKTKTQNGTIPWVITGDAVSKQYAKLRADASEFAKLRNACFSEATKAYVSGNKALAKELGEKGRIYCEKMKDCHYEASEAIFKDRNEQLRNMMDENSPDALDLHGLHVAEARRILERELAMIRSKKTKGRQKIVSLLVGTGHHTKGARTPSRLPSAVESFLQESGFMFRRATPGVIEVVI